MNKIACKTFHINLLKQNVERNLDVNLFSVVTADTIDDKQQIGFFLALQWVSRISTLTLTLISRKVNKSASMDVLRRYTDIFTDIPGSTKVLIHEVRTTIDKPVRIAPRRLQYSMLETVKGEVKRKLNIIEPSDVQICLLLFLSWKKKLHVDFHSLNKITLFDAEPMPK